MPARLRPLLTLALAVGAAALAGCASRPAPAARGATLPPSPASPASPAPAAVAATLADAPDLLLSTGEVTLRYRVAGPPGGEPVVLLHGYTGRVEMWRGIGDSLARDMRVIALDQRGFGRSTKFADPARYGSAYVGDLARVLDHLGVRRAHLVGHSMGGLIAARFAMAHPDRARSVTLIGSPAYPDSATAAPEFAPHIAALERGEGVKGFFGWVYPMYPDSTLVAIDRRVLAQNDLGALIATLRALPGGLHIPPDRARAMRVPALAVVGTADPFLPRVRDLARWWPGARVVELDGATHGSVLARPELLAEIRRLARASEVAGGSR